VPAHLPHRRRGPQQPDGGTLGYLWPACDQPGYACANGFFCNLGNGYCCDGGTCRK
jgi:hypothetical protein